MAEPHAAGPKFALRHKRSGLILACENPVSLRELPTIKSFSEFKVHANGSLMCASPATHGVWTRLFVEKAGALAWTVRLAETEIIERWSIAFHADRLQFRNENCVIAVEVGWNPMEGNLNWVLRGHAKGKRHAATCDDPMAAFELVKRATLPTISLNPPSSTAFHVSSLAWVASSSAGLLLTRGVPILRTGGTQIDAFVVAEYSPQSQQALTTAKCVTAEEPSANVEYWSCGPSASRSRAVLVRGCGSTEHDGCCRVHTFVRYSNRERMLSYAWIAFTDDDVYVPPCLARYLPADEAPLYAPAKHVRATGGRRYSLCGDKGRPQTEISLPAGYGIANRAFVRLLLDGDSAMLVEQCRATPSYTIDAAMSFASWKKAVPLTPMLDWTDLGVYWAGGQRQLWRNHSLIYHKVRTPYDFHLLKRRTCDAPAALVASLAGQRVPQDGYAKTDHALRNMSEPFDCQGKEGNGFSKRRHPA